MSEANRGEDLVVTAAGVPWCSTATLAAHGLRQHAELLQRPARTDRKSVV